MSLGCNKSQSSKRHAASAGFRATFNHPHGGGRSLVSVAPIARINAAREAKQYLPWRLSFAFGRASAWLICGMRTAAVVRRACDMWAQDESRLSPLQDEI
jgi:hypothetical protein